MNTRSHFAQGPADRLVYIRTVPAAELPEEMRQHAGDADHVYAVHSSEGERLALVGDRRLAFLLARQHDLSPVSVH